ncbi:hypothetical protein AVEN_89832-1, partial [Araneus ventricosus]
MTRYIHSPSLKSRLVARVFSRWQVWNGTVKDGGNAGEEFLCVGICEVFFCYERSARIPSQIRKSCTWSFVVCQKLVSSVCASKWRKNDERATDGSEAEFASVVLEHSHQRPGILHGLRTKKQEKMVHQSIAGHSRGECSSPSGAHRSDFQSIHLDLSFMEAPCKSRNRSLQSPRATLPT